MRFRRPSILLALLLSAVTAGAATAQTPATSPSATASASTTASASANGADTEAMTDKARDLFREGTKLYRAQKWAQAEAAFEAAWALTDKKSKGLVNNLGQTEMHLGKWREAAEHLTTARRLAGKNDKQLPDIERDLAEAKKKVGTLNVTASVEGARVLVGEQVIGKAPLEDPVFVEPGKVTLSALLEGYQGVKVEVEVSAGQEMPVTLELQKPNAAPSATATASAAPTADPPARSMVPAFVIGGVGVAALIAGGVLIGVAESDRGDLRASAPKDANGNLLCWKTPAEGSTTLPACDAWRAKGAGINTEGNAGIGLLIGGGVALAGAAFYWLWASKPRAPEHAAERRWVVAPVIGQSGGGFVWTGDF
ncbi:MAG: PEGA domain-containing protein [Polyangiaceae bacterium]